MIFYVLSIVLTSSLLITELINQNGWKALYWFGALLITISIMKMGN